MAEESKVDELVRRIKSNRWLSYIIFIGIVFLAILAFAEGLQKAGSILGSSFASGRIESRYDADTKDALISASREIDEFFLRMGALGEGVTLQAELPFILKIEADLRSILLRNRIRPANDISVAQSELLLEQWDRVRELLEGGLSNMGAEAARAAMFDSFEAMLTVEEYRKASVD